MKVLRASIFGALGAVAAGAVWLAAPADSRQYRNAEGNSVSQGVVLEIGDAPISGTNPIPSAPVPPTWSPVLDNTIDADNAYQVLCTSAKAGGTVQHQGAAGSPSLWVDVTGATGGTRSRAAMEVVSRGSSATAPGVYRFPATAGQVTIMGTAGTTFQAFCG